MADNRVIVELGTVIKNRGEWDSLAQNAKLYKDNVVQYNGSAYIVKSAPASGIGKDILPTNTAYYEVFAGVGEVATGSDFDAPSAAQRGKITTVGAVLDGMNDGVYNLTAKTGDSYATLNDALIAANNTIPTNKKRGGMSICFENSSDHKYVQYRLTANEWSIDTEDWALCSENVLVENPEYIKAWTDSVGHLLFWIRKEDGGIDWAVGIPTPVKVYVDAIIKEILDGTDETDIDGLNKVIAFLDGFSTSNTLATLLNNKVDKVTGKSLIQSEVSESFSFENVPEYMKVETDSVGKILSARYKNGVKKEFAGLESQYLKSKTIDSDTLNLNKLNLNELNLTAAGEEKLKQDLHITNDATDIVNLNNPKYTIRMLSNLKRMARSGSTLKATPLVFLHASDIHGNGTSLDRIIDYKKQYQDYIDDAIITGDIVRQRYTDGIDFYTGTSGANDIMLVIGNHDTRGVTGEEDEWTKYVGADSYNRYIKDFATHWGIVSAENHCYYYKDYDSYKIRLIALDCMEGATAGQLQFLSDALAATLTGGAKEGYSVIMAIHYPANEYTPFECSFNTRQRKTTSEYIASDFINTVESFIENSGKFICWLTGHLHIDEVGIISNTNQVVISIDTASYDSQSIYSDTERTVGTKTQDLFNLVGIDTYQKIIKVMRVGADVDSWLRSKEAMVIQYASNDLYVLTNDTPILIDCH